MANPLPVFHLSYEAFHLKPSAPLPLLWKARLYYCYGKQHERFEATKVGEESQGALSLLLFSGQLLVFDGTFIRFTINTVTRAPLPLSVHCN